MTPDIQFLINCCKTSPSASDIEQIRHFVTDITQQQLTEMSTLALGHGVYPVVYHALQSNAADLIPDEFQVELKQSNINIVAQNLGMTAELIRLIRLLEEGGVKALAFKGPALSQLAYGDFVLRQYCDLDILIKRSDAAKAIALLVEDNYIPEIDLPEGTNETFMACVNVIGLSKKIHIEIHWELLSTNYAIDWPEELLWKSYDTVSLNNTAIPTLASNTHLLYLCTHSAKHLFERLEWVCDIDRFIRVHPDLDWQNLFREAQKLGIERMLMLALYLCNKLLSLQLPDEISAKVFNDPTVAEPGEHIIGLHFSSSNRQGRSYSTFTLLWRMRENLSDRLRFAYRGMFAPKIDDFKYIVLPRQLVFLYPIIRPFRLLTKYFRK